MTALVLFGVGVAAGIVNTLAGGGSFLTLSAMVWLGMPADVANGTNRLGVLSQCAASAAAFRQQGVEGGPDLPAQAVVVSLGAVLGALASVQIPTAAFEGVLGVAMIAMVGLSLAKPSSWSEPGPAHASRWAALFGAGLYGGFLQAGVGVLLLPALVLLGGLDPVRANARKVALVLVFTLPALAVFAASGLVDWTAGVALAAGSAVGGVLGTKLAVQGGERLIRGALVVVVVATGLRLLL